MTKLRRYVSVIAFLVLCHPLVGADQVKISVVEGEETPLTILAGPSLFFPTRNSLSVWWSLSRPVQGHSVQYGPSKALGLEASVSSGTATPVVTLSELKAGQTYYYRVQSGQVASRIGSFRVPDYERKAFRIVAWGDNQHGIKQFRNRTVPIMQKLKPDLLLGLGDFAQKGEQWEDWLGQLYRPGAALLGRVPLVPTRGNHDGETPLARGFLPQVSDMGTFAASYGPLRLLVLNSNLSFEPESKQRVWLDKELAGAAWAKAKFRVVAVHKPPYSVLWDNEYYKGEKTVREQVVPLLEKAKADILLAGHSHGYQRGYRQRPDGGRTYYVVSGGGGGRLDFLYMEHWPHMTKMDALYHVLCADVSSEKLTVTAIDSVSGKVFDTIVLEAH